MRRLLIGAVIGAALVAFAPAMLQALTRGGFFAGTATTVSPPPSATLAPGVAQQVAKVSAALAQASQSRQAIPVTLTFTERDLTASAARYFPQTYSGVTLSDPVVHLRSGGMVLDMVASASFLTLTAEVVATPVVANGRPAATITSATIGGVQAPQQVRDTIAQELAQALAAGLPAKFVVTAIAVGEGTTTVTGTANP